MSLFLLGTGVFSFFWIVQATDLDALDEPESTRCGYYCAHVIARYVDRNIDFDRVDLELKSKKTPFSIADLELSLSNLGFSTIAANCHANNLTNDRCPCIMHVQFDSKSIQQDHFIVCLGVRTLSGRREACIVNFPGGPTWIPWTALQSRWRGDYILVRKHFFCGWLSIKSVATIVGVLAVAVIGFRRYREAKKKTSPQITS